MSVNPASAVALKPLYASLAFAVVLMAVGLLVVGKDLLIPIAIAVLIWYVLNALAATFGRVRIGGKEAPSWARMTVAILSVVVAIAAFVELVNANIDAVTRAAPTYQANLERLVADAARRLGFSDVPTFAQLIEQVDLGGVASRFASTAADLAGSTGLIVIYVVFLLVEQQSFDKKLAALFPDPEREKRARKLLHRIQVQIQTFIWIKTLMAVLTAGVSYAVLAIVGVDFAAFWAVVIFLLNYIPTIGALIGTVFPTVLALVQFGTPLPAVIVGGALTAANVVIGNVLEPRLMGASLNMSALVVILSLAIWGTIWGIAGMFLCVPITVVAMIICSHFPASRGVAVLLSADGKIDTGEDD